MERTHQSRRNSRIIRRLVLIHQKLNKKRGMVRVINNIETIHCNFYNGRYFRVWKHIFKFGCKYM